MGDCMYDVISFQANKESVRIRLLMLFIGSFKVVASIFDSM